MPKISKPQVIGIVGSRRRNSKADLDLCLAAFLKVFRPGDRLVSGGCPQGGDLFAEVIARGRGLSLTVHYPDWKGLGKRAGFARNTFIARDCTVLIALPAKDRTGGTEDTIAKALKLGKKVILV